MLKQLLQRIVRLVNLIIFKRNLPNKISIYFHETDSKEIEDIKKIIKYFKKRGYKFSTVTEFSKSINNNDKDLAITFDDGFSSWVNVLPLFKEFSVRATFFMNSIQYTKDPKEKFLSDIKCFDENKLIDKSGTKKIIEEGHEIGSHTHSHRTLTNINEEEFLYEINQNLIILNSLNIYPTNFAIPFGMRRYVKDEQLEYLYKNFNSVSFGEPGMLFKQEKSKIQRYPWKSDKSFKFNLNNITTDTSLFNNLTKRSGLG